MTPYMAQGAATAMEDAAVRARKETSGPWLYGYDAWNVPLKEPALNPAS
jgi:hypothetical protein